MINIDLIQNIEQLLQILIYVLLYLFIGFGPGFILGIVIMSRIIGKNNPYIMEVHEEAKAQATEHNKQWHPDDPRWKN